MPDEEAINQLIDLMESNQANDAVGPKDWEALNYIQDRLSRLRNLED